MLNTRGIVFRTVKYGETSIIADIFTEEMGLHAFIGSGVRTSRARMSFNLFQPMSVVELVSYFRNRPDRLNRLKEVRPAVALREIPFDVKKGAVALFMAEICRKSIRETDENRPLFDFLLDNILFLDSTTNPISHIHLHFLLGLSAHLGFQPHCIETGAANVYFDLKDGYYLDAPPAHAAFLPPDLTLSMCQLLQSSLDNCHETDLPKEKRRLLLHYLLQFYQIHVPGFSDIHTTGVLEEIWG